MSKSIAYVGALAAALLVASAGTAAAQSSLPGDTGSIPGSSAGAEENGADGDAEDNGPDQGGSSDGGTGSGDDAEGGETGQLGELGELLPASVTGSLPGYATGPLGSAATFVCNVGSAAGMAANVFGTPLPVPIGVICSVLNPAAKSADALLAGDVAGSVDAVLTGVPLVGTSLADQLDTSSATESVEGSVSEGSVGDRLGSVSERLGSLTEASLAPAN